MTRFTTLARRAVLPFLAVVSALVLGGIFVILTDLENIARFGSDPLGAVGAAIGGVGKAYGAMLEGAFGDVGRIGAALQSGSDKDIATAIRPLTETLVAAGPLIFGGLGIAISFRAGMFNIGGDGQLLLGALAATAVAIGLQGVVPPPVILVVAIASGSVAGGLWGFVAGFLKARTGAHEVITTIMLNYVAAQLVLLALRSPFIQQPGLGAPISKSLTPITDVPSLPIIGGLPAIRLDWGFVVALVMAGVVSWLLFRTTKGFELRASGFSLTAARYAGMSAGGSMMLAMFLSGALLGMGGSFMVIGTVGQLSLDLGLGFGFSAIALALLAGLRPGGVVLAALLFGALSTGGKTMGIVSGIPQDLLGFIQALVIMFVAAPGLVRTIYRLRKPNVDAEVAA